MTASDCRKKRLSLYVTLLPAPQTPSTPSSFSTESRATIFIMRTCFPPILTGYVNLSAQGLRDAPEIWVPPQIRPHSVARARRDSGIGRKEREGGKIATNPEPFTP